MLSSAAVAAQPTFLHVIAKGESEADLLQLSLQDPSQVIQSERT